MVKTLYWKEYEDIRWDSKNRVSLEYAYAYSSKDT